MTRLILTLSSMYTLSLIGCGDNDASKIDEDNDGIAQSQDCDDNDKFLGAISENADCDAALTEEDCDDNDPLSTFIADDADCDGLITEDDCDDNDPTKNDIPDLDCDGLSEVNGDCDDNDPDSTTELNDADCDGVVTEDDCDDNDEDSTTTENDADCDGLIQDADCNDGDPNANARIDDRDCDGVLTEEDCDDNDPSVGSNATDGDCDGTPVGNDCDDTDPNSLTQTEDLDCDGIIDENDLDYDNDGICDGAENMNLVEDDLDCDGIINDDDLDDDNDGFCDSEEHSNLVENDSDCDGVLNTYDTDQDGDGFCDASGLEILEDQDCDGILNDDDGDVDGDGQCDNFPTFQSEDADCDGVVQANDCDDNDPNSLATLIDIDCDGILNVNDPDSDGDGICDTSGTSAADDTDCDGILNIDDLDSDGDDLCDDSGSAISEDQDCDGHLTAEDCNDLDAQSTYLTIDTDCDGISDEQDLDDDGDGICDNGSLDINEDLDCDGILNEDDLDADGNGSCDESPGLNLANDNDCDGIPAEEDCDDQDSNSLTSATDLDCDGILNEDDPDADGDENCDDSGLPVAGDLDCDGLSNSVDPDSDGDGICDSSGFSTLEDQDCDGVSAVDEDGNPLDCDDNDPASYTSSEDLDCDGILDEDDLDVDGNNICDEAGTSLFSDADCDGSVALDSVGNVVDCDDNDPNISPSATEIYDDGLDQDCDGVDATTITESELLYGELVISEIMHNPELVDDKYGEWFELYNTTSDRINLNGLIISDPNGSITIDEDVFIEGRSYFVVAARDEQTTYPLPQIDYSPFHKTVVSSGLSLDNTSSLTVTNSQGTQIDSVSWSYTILGWPDCISDEDASLGVSLSLTVLDADQNDDSLHWIEASSSYGLGELGTPGTENDFLRVGANVEVGDVIISEVMVNGLNTNGVNDANEKWFEVHNTTSDIINLKGFTIDSPVPSPDPLPGFSIEDDFFVEPLGYAVFAEIRNSELVGDSTTYTYNRVTELSIEGTDTLRLFNAQGTIVDEISYQFTGTTGWSAAPGESMSLQQLDETSNDELQAWCISTDSYGTNGNIGSPGSENSSCSPTDPNFGFNQ
ncbi:MAG: hypothetical protein CMK59_05740 [Proteobacteria bacterium]|nr:hypothetical protein [Pseudomonadota bacterium]